MRNPVRISFRNMSPPFGADDEIRDCLAELGRLSDGIITTGVVVEKHHRHHHRGNLFYVIIELTVADRMITVRRYPPHNHVHENLRVAIHDAFREVQAPAASDRATGGIVAKDTLRRRDVFTRDRVCALQNLACA